MRIPKPNRAVAKLLWRLMNPIAVRLAGIAPWWVVLETTGRRSGMPRRIPLANGPVIDGAFWLIAVHGRQASFVQNIAARPEVRVRVRRRWHAGMAELQDVDPAILRRFSLYGRLGPIALGIQPLLVRVVLGAPK